LAYHSTVKYSLSIHIVTALLFEFLILKHGLLTIRADFTSRDFFRNLLRLNLRIGEDSVLF